MVNKIQRRNRLSYNQPKLFSPKKEKEQKQSINFNLLYKIIFALLILSIAAYFIFFSSFFDIKDVMVEGNQMVAKEKVLETIPIGDNIFLASSDEIKRKILNKIPEINDVEVYKGIPNAVKIVVLEHNQAIIWKSNNKYYLISSEGYVYRDVTDEDISNYQNLPRVEDNGNLLIDRKGKIVSASFISFVQNVQNNFFSQVNIEPDYFFITESTFDLNLKTKAGFVVKFDTLRSSKKQLDDLKKVLAEYRDQISEYVDLRIDGWAYYK